ncbi:ATP-binding protein [Aneurinibacillus sp. Ricciae_BoGa-3]|uniref:two-component system histidine kinase PnpS n=1 Tax=Aneurinibacillus sp. Ricciae_BoGa-3 TaxID=3022697 RepID=UPI0023414088|nr:ATP-binding protein [Aneurinibacillus sp. Ricciae_BoGa-3]WCK55519.1 ATP-binding protein [Aneurinibacillus sp. Ricciae_BoGa-3]
MHRLRAKLTSIFLLVIVVLLLVVGLYVGKLLENAYINILEERLKKEAIIICEDVISMGLHNPQLQQRMVKFTGEIGERITIVDLQGKVLADSENDPTKLPNHGNRPEIREAIRTGIGQSIRYSATMRYDMMYVAVPLKPNGKTIGVVRVSVTITTVQETIRKLWLSLVGVLIVTLLLFGLLSTRITKSITQPIEEITKVARDITHKQFKSRVTTYAKGEVGQLAKAVNFMASSLEQQLSALQENEKRLEGILNNMFSGVMLVSDSYRIILVNAAAEELLGYKANELIGFRHNEVGRSFSISQLIGRCFETGEKIREELHIYYPTEKIIDINLAAYSNEEGEIKGVIVVLHDITAIRRLEKMRSEFVTNVSHELKTPITSIKGFTETLLDGALEDVEISRSFLTIINEESDRLYRLISDILDLSKIEQKRMPLQLEEVDVPELIKETVRILHEEARAKNIVIYLPHEDKIVIEGDHDRLQQIVLNLVSNAVSYTPPDGEVMIETREEGQHVVLSVQDTGIGIPPQHLPRIFERFYRVDRARSRESGGTGLGLAIVKHLVESHHGSITVESTEGKGTTFTVTLPKHQPLQSL